MKVLDLDMDFFLNSVAHNICQSSCRRLPDDEYKPWTREDVISFIEQNLGLQKTKRIKGKIVKHHHEALCYWRFLIRKTLLQPPFEVIHVDSHADLGLGDSSWVFIFEDLLGLDVKDRSNVENYKNVFTKYKEPSIGDYLLFALAYRWISRLVYVSNPVCDGMDYPLYIKKRCSDDSKTIQLPHNRPATDLNTDYMRNAFLANAALEPEVNFEVITQLSAVNYTGNFDYITFSKSPNYTPQSSDFIVEIMKEYIEIEQ